MCRRFRAAERMVSRSAVLDSLENDGSIGKVGTSYDLWLKRRSLPVELDCR